MLVTSSIYFTPGGKKKLEKHTRSLASVLELAASVGKTTKAPLLLVAGGDVNRTREETVCRRRKKKEKHYFFYVFDIFEEKKLPCTINSLVATTFPLFTLAARYKNRLGWSKSFRTPGR